MMFDIKKISLKSIVILLFLSILTKSSTYELEANKYKSYSTNRESVSLKLNLMKNFAKNLSNTKLLKISRSNLRFANEYSENTSEDQENNKDFNFDEILVGSILRDTTTGDLSFHKDYLENTNYQNTKKVIARARYNKSLFKIGWSKLFVETFDNASPEITSWAAGFLEGKLTAHQILDFYNNLVGIHKKESMYLNDVFKYYEDVEKFIRNKTNKKSLENLKDGKDLEYWISVAMTQAQSDGLLEGFNSIMNSNKFNFSQIYFINADGEVPELLNVFKTKANSYNGSNFSFKEKTKKNQFKKFSKEYLKEYYGSDNPEIVWNKIMSNSHCSAIIKIQKDQFGNPNDIFVGHTTWDSYSEMHRIFKKYSFSYTMYGTEHKKSEVMFSSYPGTLTSTDDFYLLNKKIIVLETTLEMLDKTIYEKHMPDAEAHVPNYIRISVANRLAKSGKEWTELFKLNNSGTYNSQWMIVDYSKFKNLIEKNNYRKKNNLNYDFDMKIPVNEENIKSSLFDVLKKNEKIQKKNLFKKINSRFNNIDILDFGYNFKQKSLNENETNFSEVFYVLEQVPGYIEVEDMTTHLFQNGFWGSYNRPYFPKIYTDAGYLEMMRRYGKTYSYFDNPRAKLINHEIDKVKNLEDMKNLMQNNSSPFNGNHMNVISPRYDLVENVEIKRASGGIDSKIVDINMVLSGTVLAISGPSIKNGLNPFSWSDWENEPHFGLPNVWNFGWNSFNDKFIKN